MAMTYNTKVLSNSKTLEEDRDGQTDISFGKTSRYGRDTSEETGSKKDWSTADGRRERNRNKVPKAVCDDHDCVERLNVAVAAILLLVSLAGTRSCGDEKRTSGSNS